MVLKISYEYIINNTLSALSELIRQKPLSYTFTTLYSRMKYADIY